MEEIIGFLFVLGWIISTVLLAHSVRQDHKIKELKRKLNK